jgi:hypothetical protein
MRGTRSVLFYAAISLALHIAWVVWMPERQPATQPDAHFVEMTFEAEPAAVDQPAAALKEEAVLAAAESRPEPSQAAVILPQPTAAKPKKPKAEPSKPSAEAEWQPSPAPQAAAAAEAAQPSQLAAAEPAPPVQPAPPKPVSILPRAAALSLDALTQGAALRCGERAPSGQADCAPSEEETGRAAQAALTRDLDNTAHNLVHLRAREHPALQRHADGSYTYDGHAFKAQVRPDGKVEFHDNGASAELRPSLVPLVGSFDLSDAVEKGLGNELYSAEKHWLLEETKALRDQLATEYRRREQQEANRALEKVLQGVLADSGLSLEKKHEAVFLLWQDCGEDGQAQLHRRAVDAFVKRYMSRGSALGFREEELEKLNAARAGLQKFAPYAGS